MHLNVECKPVTTGICFLALLQNFLQPQRQATNQTFRNVTNMEQKKTRRHKDTGEVRMLLTWLSPGRRGMEAALPWPSIGGKCSVSELPSRPISFISTVCKQSRRWYDWLPWTWGDMWKSLVMRTEKRTKGLRVTNVVGKPGKCNNEGFFLVVFFGVCVCVVYKTKSIL